MPSMMSFDYYPQSSLDTHYQFANTIDTNNILGNAEFFIKEYILKNERIDTESDPKLRTKKAVDKFNAIFKNSDFITKLINLDEHNQNKPVFETLQGERVTIDKLSSGEQQLYARIVSLMILNPQNSIILIDEPEIALHPQWQADVIQIYKNIGENNQFIISTHSPFILSQTRHQDMILLLKENNKIIAKKHNTPPLDVDINTIIKTIMDAEYFPKELKKYQEKYRKYVDNNQESSEKAQELKSKILEFESENSSFFQQLTFEKALKEV
jgi:predicted ATP-binding protein involved in virulence